MKAHKAKKEQDMFFVEIKNPLDVERRLLESIKDVLESLQRFEHFKGMHVNRLAAIAQLRKVTNQINRQVSILKAKFPERTLKAIIAKMPKEGKREHKKNMVKTTKSKKIVHIHENKQAPVALDAISAEIAAIEEKLRSLQ